MTIAQELAAYRQRISQIGFPCICERCHGPISRDAIYATEGHAMFVCTGCANDIGLERAAYVSELFREIDQNGDSRASDHQAAPSADTDDLETDSDACFSDGVSDCSAPPINADCDDSANARAFDQAARRLDESAKRAQQRFEQVVDFELEAILEILCEALLGDIDSDEEGTQSQGDDGCD